MQLQNLQQKPPASKRVSPEISNRIHQLSKQKELLQAQLAVKDAYYWLTQCTKTKDEQDQENPYKPFPKWPLFRFMIDVIERKRYVMFRKSRTVMASWLISAWAAHKAFTRPATTVVFQSQDEDRAVNDVNYSKVLWENSLPALKERWPLKKAIEKQPYNEFEIGNGSSMIGIVGNPEKVNSLHPTIYISDESSLMIQWEAAYASAVATKCLYLICNSSANPGPYWDFIDQAVPAEWGPEPLEAA